MTNWSDINYEKLIEWCGVGFLGFLLVIMIGGMTSCVRNQNDNSLKYKLECLKDNRKLSIQMGGKEVCEPKQQEK